MAIYYKYKKYFLLGICLLILGLLLIFYLTSDKKEKIVYIRKESTTKLVKSFFVDVKGSVKKPGVYEFLEGDKVLDAINIAGGLTKNATTANINLSKKLTSEMVVYVFNKSDLTTTRTANPCNCETVEVNNCITKDTASEKPTGKININTADKEALMTLTGIGEAKANTIIEYRKTNGNFKTIEDIKNVSGLGDIMFEKIKDSITV